MCKYGLPTLRLLKVIVWQADRQTDTTEIIYHAASQLVNKTNTCNWVNIRYRCCRALQDEYDQLRRALGEEKDLKGEDSAAGNADTSVQANGDVDLVAEARLLRQHKGRLEARMRVLEEHNEQLESQLKRLRQLLHDSEQVR